MAHLSSKAKERAGLAYFKKRRPDEEVDALSGIRKKFCEIIRSLPHEDLLKITEYYKPYLAYVIEYDIKSILQNMVTNQILTNNEAKRFKDIEESEGRVGVESFINNVMKKDGVVLASLWLALAEEFARFPVTTLNIILEEVTDGGQDLLEKIKASQQPTYIEAHFKELQEQHRMSVSESTRNLEEQTRDVGFESRYTELMVINQYRRTYSETGHEILETGKTHVELMEQRTKEKCERIWTEHLFRRSPQSKSLSSIVVVSGVAGIGKTTMVQKIMYDWARGTQYQMFSFVFLFKFRELNLLDNEQEPQMPLTRLIVRYYKYLNNQKLKEILKSPESLLFIFDGLDEYKHKLDFTQKQLCSGLDDYFPVHILITSLVSQTLLKGCSVLITSRPTALEALNMERVDRFAEILGFFHEQRLMYVKKFFGDSECGSEVFEYIEENAILYTMCFNPSYCRIICSVLKSHFNKPEEERGAAPSTVTELFVMFLQNILTNHKRDAEDQQGILLKLGKMAYYGIVNNCLVFYDNFEMSTFGLQPHLPSPFLSGFLKEILQRESTLEHTTYTFFHLTLQEFMAACYFYLDPSVDINDLLVKLNSCKDGRFEIFTQFMTGLARPSVFKILGGILGEFERKTAKQMLEWVKQKTEQALWRKSKREFLRVCQWLYESQNRKLIRDAIGKNLKMDFSKISLSPLDCSVLGSVISFCEGLEELKLSDINRKPECIKRLSPGLSSCRNVILSDCHFTSECCDYLSLALAAEHSCLMYLWLTGNYLDDSGVRRLCKGLMDTNCKLEKLGLSSCGLTSGCCKALSSVLSCKYSHLTEVWLNTNNVGDSGVQMLCESLRSPNCKLEKLGLRSCYLTSGCCESLSSALSVDHSRVIQLELSDNNLEDSGVRLLCEGLRSPNCKLQKLSLLSCGLTSGCCAALSSALSVKHSLMTRLELSGNKLEDSGVHLLCEGLREENCKLEKLKLQQCGLTSGCCKFLSAVLSADHSKLIQLELGMNKLLDSGVRLLCERLKHPNCKLERLGLQSCGLTSECCEALSLALSTEHSHHLTELWLSSNNLEDSGVHWLCEGLRHPNCKLKKLKMDMSRLGVKMRRKLQCLLKELKASGRQLEIIK
ncbi:NACHT, LRR and PYD domains-containing protein 3-like isoform X1 [Polypterus senegalus]|uniref:NACHT, LRR and PYD domains-containing protein 3-like isoform X1 n=2 Tax=Polypterus senegalus TaxID=55291 RepID=UPI00196427D2|nr:NACHT, LRR and PYD domains-containing protein 3-like isoform X1 [Polypterus senegalus]XP_039615797.1 NACHT, LRR and PYD domains-containing protein 3-like isoform X1 [Polypterus senegalus]XP_039615798.1 NACHT, LRR and PYD domains-containing protein 3-like isoform X1 [Polypterus senegalus]